MANVNENAVQSATQCKMILGYMKEHGSITALDAFKEPILCMRLPSRIWDLKQAGHKIKKVMITVPSGKRVAKYSLES